jgi:hypothetical protein
MVHPSRDGTLQELPTSSNEQRPLLLDPGLDLVKSGKGLRHHEVALELSWRGLSVLLKSVAGVRWTVDASSVTATASTGFRRVVRILRGTTLPT